MVSHLFIYFKRKIVFSRCGCDECVTSRFEDSLRHSRSRINAYRALASPSLIALSSKDPILTAFELSWELRRYTGGGDVKLKRNRVGSIISVSDWVSWSTNFAANIRNYENSARTLPRPFWITRGALTSLKCSSITIRWGPPLSTEIECIWIDWS